MGDRQEVRRIVVIGLPSAAGAGTGFGVAELFDASIFGDLSLSLTVCTLAGALLGCLSGWILASLTW